jgi:hypothetical protein
MEKFLISFDGGGTSKHHPREIQERVLFSFHVDVDIDAHEVQSCHAFVVEYTSSSLIK